MDNKESQVVARLTIVAITVSLVAGGLTWLDARHASSSDVYELKTSIDRERLERIEFEIGELERNALTLRRSSTENQSRPEVEAAILELNSRRERYLRKREELLIEMEKK